ncbi:MAG: hypothetical protein ACKOKB_04175 [Bacteroidota bacterium]
MKNSNLFFVVAFLSAWIFSSCNLINPEENAPGFIQVNDFVFNPTPTSIEMGSSNSTKIKDVWVYVDNKFLGAYELPAKFPVLKTGKQKILLTPGIELNGIASTRSPYPFYKGYVTEEVIPENGTLTINPTTQYFDAVQCAFCESFDGSGFSLAPTDQSDTIMYQLAPGDTNVFEGAGSGVVYLDTTNTQFEFSSTTFYELPGSGAAVYLEMDYKCSQEMQVGLYIDLPSSGLEQVPIYVLNPSQDWNKIYIQLGYVVSTYSYSNKFKIYLKGIKNSGSQKASFYFDNIKVVHF